MCIRDSYFSFTLRSIGNIPEFNVGLFLRMSPWLSLAAVVLLHALNLYSKQRNGFMPILRAVITAAAGLTVCGMIISLWLRGITLHPCLLYTSLYTLFAGFGGSGHIFKQVQIPE